MASPSVFSGHAPAAYLVDPETAGTFDAFRPKIQFLTCQRPQRPLLVSCARYSGRAFSCRFTAMTTWKLLS